MAIKQSILLELKAGLDKLKREAGNRLSEIHLLLNDISEYVRAFDDDWIALGHSRTTIITDISVMKIRH